MADKKKKNTLKSRIYLLIFAALIFCIVYYQIWGANKVNTEVARYGKSENMVTADGFIIRNEKVYSTPAGGVLSFYAQEGERVCRGQKIATAFTGQVDKTIQNKLSGINERLTDLESNTINQDLSVGDPVLVDNSIRSKVDDIVLATYNNDTSKIKQYKDDITILLDGKTNTSGKEKVNSNTAVERLRKEKEDLENSISGNHYDIYSEESGVFSSVVDGLESYFDYKKINELTPSKLKNAENMKETRNDQSIKIADNYQWYYAANVDASWATDLKAGNAISLRFPSISDQLISATVCNVSKPENGLVTLVLSCSESLTDIYSTRKISADIVRQTYSGFKLPKSAIRVMPNGQTGVFVVKEHIARFRKVEISYSGEDYVIVKEDNSLENSLLLYDEVIVSGQNVKDGDIVK